MNYSETQVFELLRRLIRIYSESFPDNKEGLEHFSLWAHRQFGYEYDNHKQNN
jgi:hypothetical protein